MTSESKCDLCGTPLRFESGGRVLEFRGQDREFCRATIQNTIRALTTQVQHTAAECSALRAEWSKQRPVIDAMAVLYGSVTAWAHENPDVPDVIETDLRNVDRAMTELTKITSAPLDPLT